MAQRRQQQVTRRLLRTVRVWMTLDHPNIVPFLGVAFNCGDLPALVTPFYVNGNIDLYRMPDENRLLVVSTVLGPRLFLAHVLTQNI